MKLKYYDTHCHLNLLEDNNELNMFIKNIYENNLITICIGTDPKNSLVAIELGNKYKQMIYPTIGIHPNDVDLFLNEKDEIFNNFEKLLKENPNIVGIGETGLDYYRNFSSKENQKTFFIEHIRLASKFKLPLIVHVRDAYDDVYEILKKENAKKVLIHCYSSNWNNAKKFIDIGCLISFAGPITFPKSIELHEVVEKIPMDKFVLETDSPWLSPIPFRGKRNQPINVIHIYKKVCEIKKIELDELIEQIELNVKSIFKFI